MPHRLDPFGWGERSIEGCTISEGENGISLPAGRVRVSVIIPDVAVAIGDKARYPPLKH